MLRISCVPSTAGIVGLRQHQRRAGLLRLRGPFEQQPRRRDVADRDQALGPLQQVREFVGIEPSCRRCAACSRGGSGDGSVAPGFCWADRSASAISSRVTLGAGGAARTPAVDGSDRRRAGVGQLRRRLRAAERGFAWRPTDPPSRRAAKPWRWQTARADCRPSESQRRSPPPMPQQWPALRTLGPTARSVLKSFPASSEAPLSRFFVIAGKKERHRIFGKDSPPPPSKATDP